MNNSQQIQIFFIAMAGLATGAYSLMFAALQFRDEVWTRGGTKRAAAVAALTELLVVALCSMIAIAPGQHLRWATGLTGSFGLVVSLVYIATFLRHWREVGSKSVDPFDGGQFALTFLSLGVYALLIAAPHFPSHSETLLSGLLIWLMFSGLTEVAAFAAHSSGGKPAES